MRELSLAALILALAAGRATASHEDFGLGARAAGMGEAFTAVGADASAASYNPALVGGLDNPQVELGARRAFQMPAGPADHDQFEASAGAPLRAFPWRGGVAVHSRQTGLDQLSLDRSLGITYGTRGWRETDDGVIDWGVSLNALGRSGRSVHGGLTKAGVDLGALYRIGERFSVGAALLNVNGPRTDIGGVPDRAPVIGRVGVAQVLRNFTAALDVVRREPSSGRRATTSVAAGIERWVQTGRFGGLGLRGGLNLGDHARTFSLGAGWRVLGGELNYALLIPTGSGSRWGNAVSLLVRFGSWNPEREYEKLLGSEMKYRQDLTKALDAAEVKHWKLAEDLRKLRAELQGVQAELNARTADEAAARQKNREANEKIRQLEERERAARETFENLDKERQANLAKSKETLFREDWRAYQRLKLQGAPDLVLLERVKQLLRQYKESGVDLGEANQELRRLLRTQP